MKQIRIKKWSTHWSIRIWDNGSEEFPRVRVASIDSKGRSPHKIRILKEESNSANIITQ